MADPSADTNPDHPPLICRDGLTISGSSAFLAGSPSLDSTAETAASEPRRIGKFTFIGQVGAGAFGVVWKARDEELGRTVAIKMLHPGVVTAKSDRERFLREARAAAQLRHPGIVPLHEVVEVEGQPAIVSAFVHGVTLRELMDVRSLRPRETAILIADIACALDYAHSLKMVHRDVKPANIMVEFGSGESLSTSIDGADASQTSGGSRASTTRTGSSLQETGVRTSGPRALLLDFGLALRDDVEATLTLDGQIIGTPSYMSPEQAAGDGHRVDRRTDVYSLGAVLFELLTGEPPFKGSKIAAIHQVIHDSPRAPRSIVSSTPRDLETICLKAMAKSPAGRYDTALEMARDLWRWLNDEPILARRPTVVEQLRRWMRRSPAVAASIAIVALLLIVVAISASIAAVKFRSLADANEVARKAASDALRLSEESVWTMRTVFGLQAAREGNPAEGLPWFAAAAELDSEDPDRAFENRLRFSNWMRAGAVPIRAMKLEAGNEPSGLSWHPDGRRVLVHCRRTGLVIWDPGRNELVPLPTADRDPHDQIFSATWSPDGLWLALGSLNGVVELCDVTTWKSTHRWQQSGAIGVLTFSPDGSLLASGGASVRIWNMREQRPVGDELIHPGQIRSITFDRIGERIVTACQDNLARVFRVHPEVTTEPLIPPVPNFISEQMLVIFSSQLVDQDRMLLTHGAGMEILSWDSTTGGAIASTAPFAPPIMVVAPDQSVGLTFNFSDGQLVSLPECRTFGQPLKHFNSVYSVSFRPDSAAVATASGDRSVRIWSTRTGRPAAPPIFHQGDVRAVAYAPDGRHLVTAQVDGLVRVWTIEPLTREIEIGGGDSFVEVSDDGRQVFRGPWQGTQRNDTSSRAYNVETGEPVGRAREFRAIVNGTFFSPSGTRAVTIASQPLSDAGIDLSNVINAPMETMPGQVFFWDWQSGEETAPRIVTPSEPIGAAWSSDAALVAVLCAGGDVLLLDAGTGATLRTMHHGSHFTPFFVTRRHVQFAEDGQSFVTWADSLTNVWNTVDGEKRFSIDLTTNGTGNFTHDVRLSPDGRLMAVAGSDKLLRIVDYATGEPAFPPLAHPDWVFTCCFSSDGSRILTACRDGMARLWNVKDGTLACPALPHTDEVFAVTITQDDRWLITVGRDSTTRFWSARNGKPVCPPITMPGWMYDVRATADNRFALVSGVSDKLTVFDLKSLLQPGDLPTDVEQLKLLSEVVSGQTLHDGGAVNLTAAEWLDRWNSYHGPYPRELSSDDARYQPSPVASLRTQLSYHTTWGRWPEAAEVLTQIIAADPARFRDYFDLATLQLHLGNMTEYYAVCREMQSRFGDTVTQSGDRAEQIGKTLLLAPEPLPDVSPIVDALERGLEQATNPNQQIWYIVAGALADYRAANYTRAQERLNQFHEQMGDRRMHLNGMAFALKAMAEHQLGDAAAAADSLSSAQSIVAEQLPQPDKGTWFQSDWSDWLRCLILVREAEGVLARSIDGSSRQK